MHSCPNCGYCPHCGRSNPTPIRPSPWPQPYGPYWISQPNPNTTIPSSLGGTRITY